MTKAIHSHKIQSAFWCNETSPPFYRKNLSNISPNGRIFKNQPSLMKTIDSLENLQVKVNRQIMKTTNKMLYSLRTFDKLTPSTKLVNLSWSCDTLVSLNITASTNFLRKIKIRSVRAAFGM